jgi:FHS family L-fucose permease-like MFS transporter
MQELNLESGLLPEGKTAEQVAANYYLASLILFVSCRFLFTYLMKFIRPGKLLTFASLTAIGLALIVVFIGGRIGVYSLVAISGCMSLMFPTIFGLAVKGLGPDTKLGGSFLIMTIVGGAVITQIQGVVSTAMENQGSSTLPPGINMAYLVPAACFVYIAWYANRVTRTSG